MKSRHDYSTLSIEGLNIEKLINSIRQDGVVVYDINRLAYNKTTLVVRTTDINKVSDRLDNQTMVVDNTYGLVNGLKGITHRIGLVIGVIISIAMVIVLSMYTLHIEVVGLEDIDKSVVIDTLSNYGIHKYKINKYNKKDLENYILQSIDGVSLVSTKMIGTTLIVNIKEKSSQLEPLTSNYVSPYNMIINSYEIYAGNGNIKVGDMVREGDVLIYAGEYTSQDGVLHLIAPRGTINATMWHTATYTLPKSEIVYKPTGRTITNTTYRLGDKVISKQEYDNTFQYNNTVTTSQLISYQLLPIYVDKTIYAETEPVTVQNDLSNCKDEIIANLTKVVYNKLQDNEQPVDKVVDIKELEDRYIVNVYLQCNATINVG